jgi:hypothetical protein
MLVPICLNILAAIGFVRLTLPRYHFPTLIASTIAVGLFLRFLTCQQGSERRFSLWGLDIRAKTLSVAMIVCLSAFAVCKLCAVQGRVLGLPKSNGLKIYADKMLAPSDDELAWYTYNSFDFVTYCYHNREGKMPKPTMVVSSMDIAMRWQEFSPGLHFSDIATLYKKTSPFLFVSRHGPIGDSRDIGVFGFTDRGFDVSIDAWEEDWSRWIVSPNDVDEVGSN